MYLSNIADAKRIVVAFLLQLIKNFVALVVSIGPNMYDIHTSRERLDIASTKRTWDFLLAVLKAL